MAGQKRRKLSRIQVFWRRRAARKAEAYIATYPFPPHIERRVSQRAGLDGEGWELVERGLRQWFICCAWRGWGVLGMPSRLVDEAWHEFILDSLSYTRFCEFAFGTYLHHTPDEAMSTPMADATLETVRAWDRSDAGSSGEESVLWDLDIRLGAAEPLGLDELQVNAARTRAPYAGATGWACAGVVGAAGWAGDGGFIGGGEGGGGEGGGGGCSGGGGCGGGGCGGGS